MDIDKKTIAEAAAAVAVGVAGAVAYGALKGKGAKGAAPKKARPPQGQGKRKPDPDAPPPTGPINLNQASPRDLMSLKHIGKARAKRILHARPIKSVDDLVSRGLLPAEVLDRVRDRLAV